ncbi:selenide, water dikinase [Galendromus occidentalis]|uniref:Selenide, water dikinase n=1 Tax=Galendromus occidentalis TaxID=34638 RepID=A0AAJ6QZ61_9ACAR|nr:selenide, water dikinase [Galendromus occidentalis]
MDCSVVPLGDSGFSLVQTIDYFYPSVEDPYMNGQIACANVLSDLYSMGVTKCDNMLMVLAVPKGMTYDERQKVVPLLMKGLNDHAIASGTRFRGGQTILNPWPIIGGVATACVKRDQIVMPDRGVEGDVLLLTKPLGTQVAVNAHQWLEIPEKLAWLDGFSKETIKKVYFRAMDSMARLNRIAASLMLKYECHGCTDVTGFGILGHSENLAKAQMNSVDLKIFRLPVIRDVPAIVQKSGKFGKLFEGTSAETSGGLLMILRKDKALALMSELKTLEGMSSWIVGEVIEGNRNAFLEKDPEIIEVPDVDEEGYLW